MEERTIVINGLHLHVLLEGEGPPVLLLHGFPDSAHLWRHVTPRLVAAGFKVIAYDQRGFGQSDAPAAVSEYDMDKIVSDAVGVLNALGVTAKVRLVGHDWGAFIGWYLSLTHPELIERYVAVSVGHPLAYRHAGFEQRVKGWYVIAFQFPGFGEWMISSNNYQALREMSKDREDSESRVSDFSRPGRLTAGINWYRANFWRLFNFKFGRSRVPTMGIYSPGDVALTENQMRDSQKYMDAEWKYVSIPNSTHWIPLDQPDLLAASIIEWFRG
jgi:pimeloyl-ACP methyl ester carboxylesterase